MSEVATKNTNALAAYGSGGNPFVQAGEELGGSGGKFLKFNANTGEFVFGQDQDELPHGSKLSALMDTASRGFICWVGEEVIDEVMVRVIDGHPPRESELEEHGPYDGDDGWSEQVKIDFKDPDGEVFVFKSSSKAAARAFGTLLKEYGRQYKNHPDEYPIVELGASSYMPKEKKHGKKYAPIFKIVGWVSTEELDSLVPGEEDDPSNYEDGDKVVETKPAAEEKPAVVGETQAPRTRRTRSF